MSQHLRQMFRCFWRSPLHQPTSYLHSSVQISPKDLHFVTTTESPATLNYNSQRNLTWQIDLWPWIWNSVNTLHNRSLKTCFILSDISPRTIVTKLICSTYLHKSYHSPIVRWWYSEILTNQTFFSFFSIIKLLHKFLMGLSVIIPRYFSSESLSQNRLH